jgi:hypothetical protein
MKYLLVLCVFLVTVLPYLPVNNQPCYGPVFDGHPALQAECLHQLTVSPAPRITAERPHNPHCDIVFPPCSR